MEKRIPLIPDDYNVRPESIARSMFSEDVYDWNAIMLNLEEIHKRYTGKNTTVGIVDTGYLAGHPDLDDNVPFASFIDEQNASVENDATDYNGHGTHVRGIVGMQRNGAGYIGVAPDAKVGVSKAMDRDGSGFPTSIANGIRWCADNNLRYINLSLGLKGYNRVIDDALKYARSKGCVLIAASGNEAASEALFPANSPLCISTGAVDIDKVLAWFSNIGKVDVVAPGVEVRSAWIDGNYRPASGTSMAAPHVTGVCCLYEEYFVEQYSRQPTYEEIQDWISECSEDLGTKGKDEQTGAGLLTTNFDKGADNEMELDDEESTQEGCLFSTIAAPVIAFILILGVFMLSCNISDSDSSNNTDELKKGWCLVEQQDESVKLVVLHSFLKDSALIVQKVRDDWTLSLDTVHVSKVVKCFDDFGH